MNKELIKDVIIEMIKEGELQFDILVNESVGFNTGNSSGNSLRMVGSDEQLISVELSISDSSNNQIASTNDYVVFNKN